jgi:hypothetical protein
VVAWLWRSTVVREEGVGMAAREEEQRETASKARARSTVAAADEKKKKEEQDVWLKRLRSAFHAMIGRAGRLTGCGGAASGQSPVSSWRDRTRPVRDDRTLTESGQRSSGELNTLDRTRWWGPGPDAVVTTSRPV